MSGAEAGGQLPILALDVVNDTTSRPRQERRYDKADALARTRRGETKHMLGAVMPKIGAADAAQNDSVGTKHLGLSDLALAGPARRAIGFGASTFACTPHRHRDRDDD